MQYNHLGAGILTHELYSILNGTFLLYTVILPPKQLVEHVQYKDVVIFKMELFVE